MKFVYLKWPRKHCHHFWNFDLFLLDSKYGSTFAVDSKLFLEMLTGYEITYRPEIAAFV